MYSIRIAACAAATLLAGAGAASRPAPPRIAAQVRFANHLNGSRSWTLASNGKVLFSGVAAGATTAYIANTDTLSALSLRRDGSDSVVATTNFPFVGGSYYTVSATYGNGERPLLAVERDVPPRDTMP
ncbi:MAG: hypothetical protein ACREK8_02120 [Gemmatimonadales bacterium]